MASASSDIEDLLPPKPRAPQPSDCCGSGCCPCVHDIYEQDLKNWRKKCDQIKNGDLGEKIVEINSVLVPNEWREFEIVKIEQVNMNTYCYTFGLQGTQVLGGGVGQHIIVKQVKNCRVVTRQYTPVSDVNKTGLFEVLIKIYPKGKVTPLIKEWKVGDSIPWRGPFGDFTYQANSYKRIVMFAAGTGIAPLYQIIKAIIGNENDNAFIKLIYANKSISDILLRDELLDCCQFWNFTMCHYLSEESDISKKRYREEMIGRRMSKRDAREEMMRGPIELTLVLICGTDSFNKDMINSAKDAGIPDRNIFKF